MCRVSGRPAITERALRALYHLVTTMSKSQQYDLPHVKPVPPKKAAYKPFQPGPNPALPDFIRRHLTPYDPATDRYDVPAFDRDIMVDKAYPPKAIYDMHTYWSKKHWAAIREYIRHYLPREILSKGYRPRPGLLLRLGHDGRSGDDGGPALHSD